MSSPRKPQASDGVICHSQKRVGPVRLPKGQSEDFIEAFNRAYASINLTIDQVLPQPSDDADAASTKHQADR